MPNNRPLASLSPKAAPVGRKGRLRASAGKLWGSLAELATAVKQWCTGPEQWSSGALGRLCAARAHCAQPAAYLLLWPFRRSCRPSAALFPIINYCQSRMNQCRPEPEDRMRRQMLICSPAEAPKLVAFPLWAPQRRARPERETLFGPQRDSLWRPKEPEEPKEPKERCSVAELYMPIRSSFGAGRLLLEQLGAVSSAAPSWTLI